VVGTKKTKKKVKDSKKGASKKAKEKRWKNTRWESKNKGNSPDPKLRHGGGEGRSMTDTKATEGGRGGGGEK